MSTPAASPAPSNFVKTAEGGEMKEDKEQEKNTRDSNILAAKAVSDTCRTSLGPKGMDKMIVEGNGEVVITNDGATILEQLHLVHPAARMMADLGKAQDIEAGDGTTSVVVLAGSLLAQCAKLLARGVHPSLISESFQSAAYKAQEILKSISMPVDLADRESLLRAANTSLNSKLVSQYSPLLSPIAVDAVLRVIDPKTATNVNLKDIRVVRKVGGTIDDTELVDGLVFTQHASHAAGGPTRVKDAKVGLIQFCLSAPKTNMDNQVVISDYTQMDRVLREEREYILKMCKQIQKSGCNVLLIQKSILRDAVSDLSLHFLAKLKIMVVRDIERDEVEFICRTIGCKPIASIESFTADRLGTAGLVEELPTSEEGKVIKVTGVPNPGKTVSILVRGANHLIVDEAERSLHDALCVIRSLVKTRFMCPGGGAPETEICLKLREWSKTLEGVSSHCVRAFGEAFEVIPYTLAENAGLNPIEVVTELRTAHQLGQKHAGINVRKATHALGKISNMVDKKVISPLLVHSSMIQLATETVIMLLKIDGIVQSR
eukprot:TRINITY_DN907_c0_g1_i1.p1 TRINITY_DN907_c0_g1~~TRINITY_DN907_c0_g1_i1.p1  ORF type:complete len:546 (+),score=149.41 TRINITY_DN907_c0_g1_i1:27-1664(+)